MDSSSSFVNLVQEALRPELCPICGKNHNTYNCDYIKISKYVFDKPIPPKAKLSLPDFLDVQTLSDGSYLTMTRAKITKGTQFGPFQAEKSQVLEPSVGFPLKIFSVNDKENAECYLNSNNEDTCSWLMYVGIAEYREEQNLICYQDKGDIYYVAIADINVGDALKVWYSPYYAFKMNMSILPAKADNEDPGKNVDVNSLIKKQQKIMERKVWTCKFCSHIENSIVTFARHISKHYTAQLKNMCEMCKKMFRSKRHLKNHMTMVHKMLFTTPPKPPKIVDFTSKAQCAEVALGGPLLNDMFTDSSDLQQTDFTQFDLNLDNQNLLLDNLVETILNDNVKDLDHFNFEIDDGQKQFICDICLKQFTKVKLLIIHLRHHTGDFMCFKCLKIFCRKENLNSHVCNLSARHRCKICDKTFTQNKYLTRHMLALHERKFHCVSCGKIYYSNKELSEHNCNQVVNSEKEKFSCPICNKHFYRGLYLKKHLKIHGPRVNVNATKTGHVVCEICGLKLESRNSYYFHKKKHQDPKHACETCDKKFYRKDSLKEHLLTHQAFTPLECDICKGKFKTPRLLSKHRKKVHEAVRRVQCPICDITFKSQSTLNKHTKNLHSNNGDKRTTIVYYSCPVCAKSIKLKSSVHRHLKKVHSDVKGIDRRSIKPRVVINTTFSRISEKIPVLINDNKTKPSDVANNLESDLQNELDEQIDSLLTSAENNLSIQKDAVDSLVEELEIGGKKEQKEAREVCLSIPELTDNYQEITLDKNAYILDNGTIVQPQGNSDNVVIYVLDQPYK